MPPGRPPSNARRPGTSAARPGTAAGGRPLTSSGFAQPQPGHGPTSSVGTSSTGTAVDPVFAGAGSAPPGYDDHDGFGYDDEGAYAYSDEGNFAYAAGGGGGGGGGFGYEDIEEEEEESEDEDVFAFLPPSTADQERERAVLAAQHQVLQQGGGQRGVEMGQASTLPVALSSYPLSTQTQSHIAQTQPHLTQPHLAQIHPTQHPTETQTQIQYPDPTFDPWGRTGATHLSYAPSGAAGVGAGDDAPLVPPGVSVPAPVGVSSNVGGQGHPAETKRASQLSFGSNNPYFAAASVGEPVQTSAPMSPMTPGYVGGMNPVGVPGAGGGGVGGVGVVPMTAHSNLTQTSYSQVSSPPSTGSASGWVGASGASASASGPGLGLGGGGDIGLRRIVPPAERRLVEEREREREPETPTTPDAERGGMAVVDGDEDDEDDEDSDVDPAVGGGKGRRRKEVRVSLPGVGAVGRSSEGVAGAGVEGRESQIQRERKTSLVKDPLSLSPSPPPASQHLFQANALQSTSQHPSEGQGQGQSQSQSRSRSGNGRRRSRRGSRRAHGHSRSNGGNNTAGGGGAGYATGVDAGGHGQGQGTGPADGGESGLQRRKARNVNAGPYYQYAAYAEVHGGRSTLLAPGTATTSLHAHSMATHDASRANTSGGPFNDPPAAYPGTPGYPYPAGTQAQAHTPGQSSIHPYGTQRHDPRTMAVEEGCDGYVVSGGFINPHAHPGVPNNQRRRGGYPPGPPEAGAGTGQNGAGAGRSASGGRRRRERRRSQTSASARSEGSEYIARLKRASGDGPPYDAESFVDSLSYNGDESHSRSGLGTARRDGESYLDFGDERGRREGDYGEEDGEEWDGEEGDWDGEDEEDWDEGSIKMDFDFDAIDEEDSPYPEVRASVSNIDDPDMPALTIRMWFIGLSLVLIGGALNVFFNLRSPAPNVVPLALLLISYPFGKFLAYIMPIRTFRFSLPNLPRRWFPVHQPSSAPLRLCYNLVLPLTYPRAVEFSLNPGPWNIKEHVLVFIMANVAVYNPYALNVLIAGEKFYGIKKDYWFALVYVFATQLTGFGLAGMTRRFLVTPASMVWPQNLVCCTLLNTLHAEDEDDGIGMYGGVGTKGMSRYKFFMIFTTASFLWFFVPGFLFKALSIFSFVCWAAPDNIPVNQLFGVKYGLGMSFLTFDWTQITWIGSPLMVPWWAEVHIFVGFVLFYWILVPVLYYTNSWSLAYFPISANEPFDRFGKSYNVTRVLQTNDRFSETAYFEYSPLYLPATYAMTYLLAFALSSCVLVHTALYHGPQLWNGFRKIRIETDDIHAKLMKNYKEVPDWWYAIGFAFCFALAVMAVEVWDTQVPVWSLVLALMLPVIYVLPSGFIYAMTGQNITINILAQIIPGTLLPGQPFANMVFKAYAVQTLNAATSFIQDLKLGHYIKVAPRATFLVQMVGTALAAFVQVGVKQWIFANVPDVCSPTQEYSLTCPYNQVFFTASAVWGLIGPTRQFGTGSIYHPHLYAIVAGVFLPFPFWLYQRRFPKSWVRYVSIPVVLNGVSKIPPATGINYSSWSLVGFIFQYLIRKRNFAWWGKFNYVLSSALDSGTVIGVVVVFLTIQFPGVKDLKWWGNVVYNRTKDAQRAPLYAIPSGGLPWKDLRTPSSVVSATASAVVAAAVATITGS